MRELPSTLARDADESGRSAVDYLLVIVFLALASLAVIRTLAGTGGQPPSPGEGQADTVTRRADSLR